MLFTRSKSLTPTDAAAAMARGELQLIDVREAAELSDARIDGARHIPLRAAVRQARRARPRSPRRLPLPIGQPKRDRHPLGHESRA